MRRRAISEARRPTTFPSASISTILRLMGACGISDEFNLHHLRGVAFAAAERGDAGITALAVLVLRTDLRDDLLHGVVHHEHLVELAARVQRGGLAHRD